MKNQERNEKCNCGSGIKYKKCCMKEAEPKVLFGNGMTLTFEQHQKKVQDVIDSVIRDAADPIVSLMALYNNVADGEKDLILAARWPEESLTLIMSSINELDTKK